MTDARFRYAAYGLAVTSNLELPGLAPAAPGGDPLVVHAAQGDDFASPATPPHHATDAESLWHLQPGRWLLRYDGRAFGAPPWQVEASDGGRRLDVRWSEPAQRPDIGAFLPGPAFALALHMRGAFLLHAGAVAIEGRAAMIMGASGAGKSTTLAALVRRGLPLITDDVAVIADAPGPPRVHPGPRRLRLYSDSARAAGWAESLPRLFRHSALDDKRYVAVDTAGAGAPLPLAAIYLLVPGEAEAAPVRFLPGQALGRLVANLYCPHFLDRAGSARAAAQCARIASEVPVFALPTGRDLARLPALAERILASFPV